MPAGYTPLAIELEPLDGLASGPAELAAARPCRVAGLAEAFVVYAGTVRGALPFAIVGPQGDTRLGVRVRYQACSSTICYPPSAVWLGLPLRGLPLLRDERRV